MSADTRQGSGWPAPFEPAIPGAKPPHPDGSHPGRDCEIIPDTIHEPTEATILPRTGGFIATEWISARPRDLVNLHALETTRVEPYEEDQTPTMFAFARNDGSHVESSEGGSPNGTGIITSTADTVEVRR